MTLAEKVATLDRTVSNLTRAYHAAKTDRGRKNIDDQIAIARGEVERIRERYGSHDCKCRVCGRPR